MEILLLNLKIAGLTLLLSVGGCTSDICNQAIDVANLAINFVPSTQTVTEPITYTQPSVQNTQNSVIITGEINQPSQQLSQQNMEIILKDSENNVITDTINVPITNLSYLVNVDYLVNGISQKSDITMSSSDGQSRTMLGSERGWNQRGVGGPRDDGSVNFSYRLNSTGEKTVTFTAGETTKTITINVQ